MNKLKKIFYELSLAQKLIILAKYKEQELTETNQSVCTLCNKNCNLSECDLQKLI